MSVNSEKRKNLCKSWKTGTTWKVSKYRVISGPYFRTDQK